MVKVSYLLLASRKFLTTRPVNVTVHTSAVNVTSNVLVTVHDNGKVLKTHSGPSNRPFQFNVESPELWSPDSPKLYNVTVKLGNDKVQSYTGFRTIEKGKVNGVVRPMLNGEFVFMFGTLDQGFWPDGIYTPPTKEAMIYDLKVLKSLGFNMVRKHVSCDSLLSFVVMLMRGSTDQSRDRTILPSM
jgi:beta-galactosidase/beta-glucuronidase